VQGVVRCGELLYIPFGWWHQMESDGAAVSVTYRWNPYESAIRSATTARMMFAMSGAKQAALSVYSRMLESVPPLVSDIMCARFEQEMNEEQRAQAEGAP